MSISETGASSVIWTSDIINSPRGEYEKENIANFFKASIISCIALRNLMCYNSSQQ